MKRLKSKKVCKLVALSAVSLMLCTSTAYAASSGIRSNKDNECAIWMCLPQGFISGECRAPFKSFIKRITDITKKGRRRYTDLPRYGLCKEDMNRDQRRQMNEYLSEVDISHNALNEIEEMSNVAVDYRYSKYKIVIPKHTKCTAWRTKNHSNGSNNHSSYRICVRDKEIQEQIKYSYKPYREEYEISKRGDKYNDRKFRQSELYQTTQVFVGNEPWGDKYEQKIDAWIE